MPATTKRKKGSRSFVIRMVSLVMAALLLGGVLLAAVLTNVY